LWMKRAAEVSSEFVNLWLKSPLFFEQLDRGNGATVDTLTIQKLQSVDLRLPPLAEQQRIVGILDEAFAGVATAKANAERNLKNARVLFESHLQSVFAQKGEGWMHTTIGDQVTLQRGFDITKRQQHPGDIPVVSSGGIKSFHDTAMVQAPGVVLGRKGTLGKVFYLAEDFWPHDTTLWVKKFNGNIPRFVYYFFTHLDVADLDSGAANPALNRNQVHPIEVHWPPVVRQQAIVDKLASLSEETQRLVSLYQQKLDALDALKKSLLHRAFTGEL
jgi:type I restriction enzyme, S subunit